MKPVRVIEAARADIRAQQRFYDREQPGLGERFGRAVATTLLKIADQPEAMQAMNHEIRRWPVKGFPHGVMYWVGESEVVVISVFHPKRDPTVWASRVQDGI